MEEINLRREKAKRSLKIAGVLLLFYFLVFSIPGLTLALVAIVLLMLFFLVRALMFFIGIQCNPSNVARFFNTLNADYGGKAKRDFLISASLFIINMVMIEIVPAKDQLFPLHGAISLGFVFFLIQGFVYRNRHKRDLRLQQAQKKIAEKQKPEDYLINADELNKMLRGNSKSSN